MASITVPLEFELTPRSRAVMNALSLALDPKFVDLEDRPTAVSADAITPSISAPVAPGAWWPEQDGWYAGLQMTPGGRFWHLIVPKAHIDALADVQWGGYGTQIEGAADVYDGLANTEAMAAAGLDLAKRVQALGEGLYLPSRAEALLMFATLKDQIGEGYVWASTQYSASNAWCQYFGNGGQGLDDKAYEFRAVAVRRLSL